MDAIFRAPVRAGLVEGDTLGGMLCPNCMSPYVEPAPPDPSAADGVGMADEQLMRCTECEYCAPRSEFVPENYR